MSLRGKGTICEKGDTNPPQTLQLSGTRCWEEATRPRPGVRPGRSLHGSGFSARQCREICKPSPPFFLGFTPPTQSNPSFNTIPANRERMNKQGTSAKASLHCSGAHSPLTQPRLPSAEGLEMTKGLEKTSQSSPPPGIFRHASSQVGLSVGQRSAWFPSLHALPRSPVSPWVATGVSGEPGGRGHTSPSAASWPSETSPASCQLSGHPGFPATRTPAWSFLSRPQETVSHAYQRSGQSLRL